MSLRRWGLAGLAAAVAVTAGAPASADGAAPVPASAPVSVSAPVSASAPVSGAGLVVSTDRGLVRGKAVGATHQFQGIPYARPPVGGLRWRSPQPAASWAGVRDATRPGPRCAQSGDAMSPRSYAEDCLYLNVTSPRAGAPTARRPVFLWLAGGFVSGAGADFDPTPLVTGGDAVAVTVNHRFGAFGFFDHPALGRAGGDYGVEDQVAALRWISRNAAAFGGDPHNVTVFGESSGAFGVCTLLATPSARGLIDKAIMQSGTCSSRIPRNVTAPGLAEHSILVDHAAAMRASTAAAAELGCPPRPDVLACLRAVPAKRLVDNSQLYNGFSQYVYGTAVVPEDPKIVLRTGRTPRIPTMVGSTADEMQLFVAIAAATGTTYDAAQYQHLLADTYGEHDAEVQARYPIGPGPWGPALAWAKATTDDGWSCRTQDDARALAAGEHRAVFSYEFADRSVARPVGYPVPPGFPFGAYHGSELLSLFTPNPGQVSPPASRRLSALIVRYWSTFARTGSPNGPGLPHWPRFTPGGDQTQTLTPGAVRPGTPDARHQCVFWDSTR